MHRKRAIRRYLESGLHAGAESRLLAHLRGCAACRAYYDQQALLLRALAGAIAVPTRAEEERLATRMLRAGGVTPSAVTWVDRVMEAPARSAALAFAALLLFVSLGIFVGRALIPGRAGVLVAARSVTVDGRALQPGAKLPAGARITVEKKGAAEIELARGGKARLYPGAAVVLGKSGELIDLSTGKVWCEVDRDRGAFAVRTDRAEARVLGTSFVVEKRKDGDTDVRVVEGTVEVEDVEHRGQVRLERGQRSRVASGSGPSPPRRYDSDDDLAEWERILEEIGRAVEETFKAIENALEK